MGLTISLLEQHSQGDLRAASGVATFDNSYATGGESLTPVMVGLGQFVGPIQIIEGEDGFIFKWDRANQKIVVYEAALEAGTISQPTYTGAADVPFFVEEEALAVASDIGTLAFAPAYIVSISDSTGVTYRTIPSGAAPVDDVSVAVNFTTGVLTFAAADDPGDVRVTYFPSRAGTFFDNANAVEETLTAADGAGVNTTTRAAVIQHVHNDTTPGLEFISPSGEAPGAAEIEIDINNASATTLISNAAEVGDTIAVRYLNFSALEPGMTFVDDTDVACTAGDADFALGALGQVGVANVDKLVIPGLGNMAVGEETGDGNENAVWGDSGSVEANNVGAWLPKLNTWNTSNTSAFVTFAVSQIEIDFNQLLDPTPAGTVSTPTFTGGGSSALTEVANATDLSNVVVDIYARGR